MLVYAWVDLPLAWGCAGPSAYRCLPPRSVWQRRALAGGNVCAHTAWRLPGRLHWRSERWDRSLPTLPVAECTPGVGKGTYGPPLGMGLCCVLLARSRATRCPRCERQGFPPPVRDLTLCTHESTTPARATTPPTMAQSPVKNDEYDRRSSVNLAMIGENS